MGLQGSKPAYFRGACPWSECRVETVHVESDIDRPFTHHPSCLFYGFFDADPGELFHEHYPYPVPLTELPAFGRICRSPYAYLDHPFRVDQTLLASPPERGSMAVFRVHLLVAAVGMGIDMYQPQGAILCNGPEYRKGYRMVTAGAERPDSRSVQAVVEGCDIPVACLYVEYPGEGDITHITHPAEFVRVDPCDMVN